MMQRIALRLFAAFVTLIAFCCMAAAHAQQKSPLPGNYPARPIRVVATISPGGGPDVVVRMVSQIVNEKLGRPFVLDNRPGGGTILVTDIVPTPRPMVTRCSTAPTR